MHRPPALLRFCVLATLFAATACDSVSLPDYLISPAPLVLELAAMEGQDPGPPRVYLTVADVRLDGKSLEHFRRTTIEVSAMQDGMTGQLFSGTVPAHQYSTLRLRLDPYTDDRGTGPGCYVLDHSGRKTPIAIEGDATISVMGAPLVVSDELPSRSVITFDLAKALVRPAGIADAYRLRTTNYFRQYVKLEQRSLSPPLLGAEVSR